jgi:GDPmannose 4,6-dehydratase
MFACNGILFNHESERRGEEFITRKITKGIARLKKDPEFVLELGNLDVKRDWGYAPDYVEGMWRMLQEEKPEDYVLATGETHTVREFLETAWGPITWKGQGIHERGEDVNGRVIVKVNPIVLQKLNF